MFKILRRLFEHLGNFRAGDLIIVDRRQQGNLMGHASRLNLFFSRINIRLVLFSHLKLCLAQHGLLLLALSLFLGVELIVNLLRQLDGPLNRFLYFFGDWRLLKRKQGINTFIYSE